jgi:eukaryotic-like serine/threonine-protein kinase
MMSSMHDADRAGAASMLQTAVNEAQPPSRARSPELVPGVLVDGRYRVERELARGGMGVVYVGEDTWLERKVALKVIAPGWAQQGAAPAQFHREAKALASVKSQHVVQIYAFGTHEGAYFFAMEHVRGRTLRAILKEHKDRGTTIPARRALSIVRKIGSGLAAVHAADIVHLDVKPTNVIVEDDTRRPVLLDFGLATHGGDAHGRLVAGTPRYMAPEQIHRSHAISPATDVYGLAAVTFEMLTGHAPHDAPTREGLLEKVLREPAERVSAHQPELEPLDPVLARALAMRPADRYATCAELLRALADAGEALDGAPISTRRRVPEPPASGGAPAPLVVIAARVASLRKLVASAVHLAFGLHVLVAAAPSGNELRATLRLRRPDFVLLDEDLLDVDESDTLACMRELVHSRGDGRLEVVLLAATSADPGHVAALGACEVVERCKDFHHVVDRIRALAARAGWIEEGVG